MVYGRRRRFRDKGCLGGLNMDDFVRKDNEPQECFLILFFFLLWGGGWLARVGWGRREMSLG